MRVRFTRTWFAPTQEKVLNKVYNSSGARYRASVDLPRGKDFYDLPDYLYPVLPSDAVILIPPVGVELRDCHKPAKKAPAHIARIVAPMPEELDEVMREQAEAASLASREFDQLQEAQDKADAELRKNESRREILAKARAAKAAKDAEKKATKPVAAEMKEVK